AVVIDDKTRFERLSKRGRPDDPNTLEDLRERDLREISFGLKEVIDTANYKIDNTHPKIEVQKKIRELVLKIIYNY
ncbi:MAG: dephospho-CoA kinase, partial [Candidatus Hermodarchaeota archaeon]